MANKGFLLASNRTALALVAAGLAAAEFLGSDEVRRPFALPPISVGGFVAWGGFRRWRVVERSIANDEPIPRSLLPAVITTTVVLGAAVAVVVAAT